MPNSTPLGEDLFGSSEQTPSTNAPQEQSQPQSTTPLGEDLFGAQPKPSTYDEVKKGLASVPPIAALGLTEGVNTISKAMAGVFRLGGEFLPKDNLSPPGHEQTNFFTDVADDLGRKTSSISSGVEKGLAPYKKTTAGAVATDIATGAVQMPFYVGSMMMAGPIGPALMMGGSSFEDTYQQAMKSGKPHDEAFNIAGGVGAIQGALNSVYIGKIISIAEDTTKPIINRVLTQTANAAIFNTAGAGSTAVILNQTGVSKKSTYDEVKDVLYQVAVGTPAAVIGGAPFMKAHQQLSDLGVKNPDKVLEAVPEIREALKKTIVDKVANDNENARKNPDLLNKSLETVQALKDGDFEKASQLVDDHGGLSPKVSTILERYKSRKVQPPEGVTYTNIKPGTEGYKAAAEVAAGYGLKLEPYPEPVSKEKIEEPEIMKPQEEYGAAFGQSKSDTSKPFTLVDHDGAVIDTFDTREQADAASELYDTGTKILQTHEPKFTVKSEDDLGFTEVYGRKKGEENNFLIKSKDNNSNDYDISVDGKVTGDTYNIGEIIKLNDEVKIGTSDWLEIVREIKKQLPEGVTKITGKRLTGARKDLEANDSRRDVNLNTHKEIVEQAVDEGKPVPPDVLAQYPALEKKAKITQPRTAKEPILNEVRKRGGVEIGSWLDGELRKMGITPRTRPGLFKHPEKGGLSNVDTWVASEWNHNDVPGAEINNGYVSPQHILDSIEAEHFGGSRNKGFAPEKVAIEHDNQIEKLASDHGIEINGRSIADITNELSERMSVEQQAKEIESREIANKADYEAAQKAEKEFIESRGEAWEPHEEKQPTLQELENEWKQERIAGETQQGNGGIKESRVAAASEGAIPESSRELGSSPKLTGRANGEGRQAVIPGAERISDRELAQRGTDRPLQPKVAQEPMGEGLFGNERNQQELFMSNPERGAVDLTGLLDAVTKPEKQPWEMTKEEYANIGKPEFTGKSKIFQPAKMSVDAKAMAAILREGKGESTRDTAKVVEKLNKYAKIVNALDAKDQLALIDYMENRSNDMGVKLPDPALQVIADTYRDIFQTVEQAIVAQFPDARMREDYFTHQYQDPKAAEKFFSDFIAKQGSGKNLRARVFPTLKEAMEFGLKPRTTNPGEIIGTYVANMNNFLATHRTLERMQQTGIAEYYNKGEQPVGWAPLEGNLAKEIDVVVMSDLGEPTLVPGKQLYAPENAARVYNNDISKGFGDPYDGIAHVLQKAANFTTKISLLGPMHHFSTVTMGAMASDVARGAGLIAKGEVARGVKAIGQGLTPGLSPAKNISLGKRVQEQYLGIDNHGPAFERIVALGEAANVFHATQQEYWKAGPAKDFVDSFKAGTLKSEMKGAVEKVKEKPVMGTLEVIANGISKTADTIAKPLFDYYVPLIKKGAFFSEMHDWLDKNPSATWEQQKAAAREIGDSMDNRFGEMMRDNLFWKKTTQQVLQSTFLSYSWVVGGLRMLKGAPDSVSNLIRGRKMTADSKYLFGMAMTYAVYNAMMTYIHTGKYADDWDAEDLYSYKTGGKTPQGKPERAILPGHTTEYLHYLHDGLAELGNKISPGLKLLDAFITNEDFRGMPITNKNNSWFSKERWSDYATFALEGVEPISEKTLRKGRKKGSKISTLEQILAVRSAPEFVTNPEGYEAKEKARNIKQYQRKLRSDAKIAAQYEGDSDTESESENTESEGAE